MGNGLAPRVEFVETLPADVVIGMPGQGNLATCTVWPGSLGAVALIEAGLDRLHDRQDMERLYEVGRSLTSEQNLDKLLDLILTQAREILDAEGGSIYLVLPTKTEGTEGRELLFAHTQNAKVSLPFHRFRMPISKRSMAGYVAETGESLNIQNVYWVEASAPYRFNDAFDRQANYHSVSMLCVPMRDTEGNVLGVLQFINRLDEAGQVCAFEPRQQRLAESLAAQAGVAVKNAKLREDIENLFEGFVNASILAIEQRDPVTSGHSSRVAALTVTLARALNATTEGPYAEVSLSEKQIQELRYACLLHDFGKVGVREQVLTKAKKLDAQRLELVLQRLRQRQEEKALEIAHRAWSGEQSFDSKAWKDWLSELKQETDRYISTIVHANEPAVLTENVKGDLDALGGLSYTHWNGQTDPVVSTNDLDSLRIPKGSLSESERQEIESHVTHSYEFLQQIPWTRDLDGIPEISYAHHEKPNGSGYPRKLKAQDIPLQSRLMAIADVFDALTAQDRPYKAAVPLERSLAILEQEAKAGNLDADLLAIFVEARVYRAVDTLGGAH